MLWHQGINVMRHYEYDYTIVLIASSNEIVILWVVLYLYVMHKNDIMIKIVFIIRQICPVPLFLVNKIHLHLRFLIKTDEKKNYSPDSYSECKKIRLTRMQCSFMWMKFITIVII